MFIKMTIRRIPHNHNDNQELTFRTLEEAIREKIKGSRNMNFSVLSISELDRGYHYARLTANGSLATHPGYADSTHESDEYKELYEKVKAEFDKPKLI